MSRKNNGKKRRRAKAISGGNNDTRSPQKQHAAPIAESVIAGGNTLRRRTEIFAGPLPHPDTFAKYESIYPGAAKILFDTFQQEAKHRREQERSIVTNEHRVAIIGQVFAFLIACVAFFTGTYAAVNGAPVVGSITCGGTVISLVSVFIIGRRARQSELEQSARASRR